MVNLAKRNGARVILATGAILGLDALRAAAEGEIRSVTMITRKPPRSLRGAPYLEQHNVSLDGLERPLLICAPMLDDNVMTFTEEIRNHGNEFVVIACVANEDSDSKLGFGIHNGLRSSR